MSKKRKETMELRYYDIPQKEYVLALLGEEWIREYGTGIMHMHFHNMLEIGYCRQGKGTVTLDEEVVAYDTGTISVIPKNYPHTTNSLQGKTSYWEYIFFDTETILRLAYPENEYLQKKMIHIINRKAYLGKGNENPQFTTIVLTIMEEMRHKKEFYIETVKALTTALVFEIVRINKEKQEDIFVGRKTGISQIAKALDFISDGYKDNIKIESLAKMCNMSETHFRRLFNEYMNMTPIEYVNMIRIQMACEIMKKSNITMHDIAEKCGFVTISTFHRNFKRIVGVTPYQWKKNPQNYESKLLHFHISASKGW